MCCSKGGLFKGSYRGLYKGLMVFEGDTMSLGHVAVMLRMIPPKHSAACEDQAANILRCLGACLDFRRLTARETKSSTRVSTVGYP